MFDDTRLGVRYEYDPEKSQIVRSLMPDAAAGRSFNEFFRAVSGGQVRSGQNFFGQEVIAQEQRRVVAVGREWLEYDLTLRAGNDLTVNRHVLMRFRVDPESHLPQSMSLSELTPAREAGGQPQKIEFVFDYPKDGPVDIYDLGVPRGTKLVDLVPSPDLSRIVAAVESGRYRFDAYVAIITRSTGNLPWYAALPEAVFWRRGDCWRAEVVAGHPVPWPPAVPPEDVDRTAWWHAQLKHFRCQAVEMCDGKKVYRRMSNDVAGKSSEGKWQAITKTTAGKAIDEAMKGWIRDRVLEGYAYPNGVKKPGYVFTVNIDPHSTEGPLDCVLVKYQATDAVPVENTFRDCRYWVDPAKGYVARQYVLGDCRGADGSMMTETMTMEDLERSPRGFWYPTLVRRKVTREPPPGGNWSGETVKRFFLDFQTDIPDGLFLPKDRAPSD